jgi:hypothetical protein
MSVADILRIRGKWIEASEFTKLVANKQNISDRHAYRKIKQAWKEKEIRRVVYQDRSVVYGLSEWRPFREQVQVVIKTIKQWKKIAFRHPTPMEIADDVPIPISPQKAEALARQTKEKTGWTMPNQAIIQSATEKLGETLVCAARKRDGTISNFDYEKYPDDPEILEEAERFRKEHPEMLPKLIEDGEDVTWPEEALKYLGINYKPKDRHIATLVVIR